MHRLREVLVVTLFVAGCASGGAEQATPSATLATSPTTVALDTAAIKHDVEVAYLRSWDVYAHALRTLTTDGLKESFSGEALDSTIAEVGRLRAANTPAAIDVGHQLDTTVRDASWASVRDDQLNRSVALDPNTGTPTEAPPNNRRTFTYTIEKVNGAWLITYIARLS